MKGELAQLGKRLNYKRLIIRGVPTDLKFTLFGVFDHLKKGGKVKLIFNADGTFFECTIIKEEK